MRSGEPPSLLSRPDVVVVTGATGAVGRHVVGRLVQAGIGTNNPLDLRLLVRPGRLGAARGVAAELEDMAHDRLTRVSVHADPLVAFNGCDVGVLLASVPRREGEPRGSLAIRNASITLHHARAASAAGSERLRLAVVANPVNALVGAIVAEGIMTPDRVSGVVRVDLDRAVAAIARTSGYSPGSLREIAVWGNHSPRLVVDLRRASTADGFLIGQEIEQSITDAVRRRGDDIITVSGRTSTLSIATAAQRHLDEWFSGIARHTWSAAAVVAPGYDGVPPGVPLTFPVVSEDGAWKVVEGFEPDSRVSAVIADAAMEIQKEIQEVLKGADQAAKHEEGF